ncbi:MAG: 4Fe-4S binding protein [Deltaproteobacteria bacterium]|nr:4Fe-4S binding protein [Deltaproteobacteria bacterium]
MTAPEPDVYERLARFLDDLPGAFPRTESGVEMRILRRLFTPDEAELALHLTLLHEEPRVVARRAGIEVEEAASRLDALSRKGLARRRERDGRPTYQAAQFVIGIWEFHVNDLDPELVADVNAYLPDVVRASRWTEVPQLRIIPAERALDVVHEVLPHEAASELVRQHRRFAVAPCICRREHRIQGKGCDHLAEACLVFGQAADFYVRNGWARSITADEVLEILRIADQQGLVLQPGNARKSLNICLCCSCCCQVLKALKAEPSPARATLSAFRVHFEPERCTGCGTCIERCPMDAFQLEDGTVVHDPERCIGCGLCATTCPTGALSMERRPDARAIPGTLTDTYLKLGRLRGVLGPGRVARLVIRSRWDRLWAKA